MDAIELAALVCVFAGALGLAIVACLRLLRRDVWAACLWLVVAVWVMLIALALAKT